MLIFSLWICIFWTFHINGAMQFVVSYSEILSPLTVSYMYITHFDHIYPSLAYLILLPFLWGPFLLISPALQLCLTIWIRNCIHHWQQNGLSCCLKLPFNWRVAFKTNSIWLFSTNIILAIMLSGPINFPWANYSYYLDSSTTHWSLFIATMCLVIH